VVNDATTTPDEAEASGEGLPGFDALSAVGGFLGLGGLARRRLSDGD